MGTIKAKGGKNKRPFSPDEIELDRLLAILLRLGQERTVTGRKGDTHRGLKYLDCTQCPKQLQKARGCNRWGQKYKGPEWRIDFTEKNELDFVTWCPASVRDHVPPSLQMALWQAMRVDRAGGPLSYFGVPYGLLPSSWVRIYETSIAVRDRFIRELDDARKEVT